MHHLSFTGTTEDSYKVVLLIKKAAMNEQYIRKHYIDHIESKGVSASDILVLSAEYGSNNKAPAKLVTAEVGNILKVCEKLGTTTLLVADAIYFKKLVGSLKADRHYGYVMPCKIKDYEHINVILVPNYHALSYNPAILEKIEICLNTFVDHMNDEYAEPGTGIIHSADYPMTKADVESAFHKLLQYPQLTCDTEDYGLALKPIGTIAFAWDNHNGVAFQMQKDHTTQVFDSVIHRLMKEFLEQYMAKGTIIYHNAIFDIRQLIFSLYMKGVYGDYVNVINGLKTLFTKSIHDTFALTFLATNSTIRPELGLKALSAEFAGDYGKDEIKDITKIPFPELKEYNLVDCLSTWHTFNKYYPIVVKDKQLEIYNEMIMPSQKVICNMELVGMPLDIDNVDKAEEILTDITIEEETFLENCQEIKDWEIFRMQANAVVGNAKLKKKVHPVHHFHQKFNPTYFDDIGTLLHGQMGLPCIDRTKTKAPATGSKSLMKIANKLISDFELPQDLYDLR